MHRTETVDYVIVIEGEIEMDMDNSTVKLKPGDVMVQRGTNHAWANRSGKNARVAFVLVDAQAARHRQAGAGQQQRTHEGGRPMISRAVRKRAVARAGARTSPAQARRPIRTARCG